MKWISKAKRKRGPEWSKTLTFLILMPFLGVIGLAAYLAYQMYKTGTPAESVSIMQALLAFVAAPTAVVVGFYFWKSRAENLVKLTKTMTREGICKEAITEIINKGE